MPLANLVSPGDPGNSPSLTSSAPSNPGLVEGSTNKYSPSEISGSVVSVVVTASVVGAASEDVTELELDVPLTDRGCCTCGRAAAKGSCSDVCVSAATNCNDADLKDRTKEHVNATAHVASIR